MKEQIPDQIRRLRTYLLQPSERNEDLAIAYFRHFFEDTFIRQTDAKNADGYVPGHFVLELKGSSKNWFAAFFQALAYKNKGLAFSTVVVAAKHFLAIWRVEDVPEAMRAAVNNESQAPNAVGRKLAQRFKDNKSKILKLATWYRPEIFEKREDVPELFAANDRYFLEVMASFEAVLKKGRAIKQPITLNNFISILKDMRKFFHTEKPIKTVRAFYSMIYGPWDGTTTVVLSEKYSDRATFGGAEITHLIPGKRAEFREFVDRYSVQLKETQNRDDFFSRYDEALDAIDRDFRIRNGIFFTDLSLSKFVMWLVKQRIPHLGRNYLVIDPACGSGNLVTNWRSPLELRHKVVSEIEPELLYAVEQRMKGDQWHNGKFTVVPKVSENKGLNFLDKTAEDYLQVLKEHLKEKGQKPDRPLAFLCNPPYRSDDDQTTDRIEYRVHPSIISLIGNDAAAERYCCFLAQMMKICEVAEKNGFPDESVLLLFTKAAWLSGRPVFDNVRKEILGSFEEMGGILVNGAEFFDVSGKFPIAFTMWRYIGKHSQIRPERPIPLVDLTWVTERMLREINWLNPNEVEEKCRAIVLSDASKTVMYGYSGPNIKQWSGFTRHDFQREKRKSERNDPRFQCGLPRGDRRLVRKKTLGESTGTYLGFMDDLTPCRIVRDPQGLPWFRLNNQFMDVRKTRCFSGPPDKYAYAPEEEDSIDKIALWFALGRTLYMKGYPMWVDALELWAPNIPDRLAQTVRAFTFSIVFAENECAQVVFPAGNPVRESPEARIENPLSPLYEESYWNTTMKPALRVSEAPTAAKLIKSVEHIFSRWRSEFRNKKEIFVPYKESYFVGEGVLTPGAGLVQIRDYANQSDHKDLKDLFGKIQELLNKSKTEFYELLNSEKGLNYFGRSAKPFSLVRKGTPDEFHRPLKKAA